MMLPRLALIRDLLDLPPGWWRLSRLRTLWLILRGRDHRL